VTVTVPDSVTLIGKRAFSDQYSKLTLVCGPGSAAESFAQENSLDYTSSGG